MEEEEEVEGSERGGWRGVGGRVGGGSKEARGGLVFGWAGEIRGEGEKETEREREGLHARQVISPLAAFRHVSL